MRRVFGVTLLSIHSCATAMGATPSAVQAVDDMASVEARRETETVGTSTADDADDIAIWVDPDDSSGSLVIGTNKKSGLFVYGMDGRIRGRVDSGKMNNVDLRNGVTIEGRPRTVIAASDESRSSAMIALYALDPGTKGLTPLGRVPGGRERAYGLCLYQQDGQLWAFNVFRDGVIEQVAIDVSTGVARATPVRRMKLRSNAEGCVADDRTRTFYAAERDVGIWKWGADPDASGTPARVAPTDKSRLVADVEGLALAQYGEKGGYLIASSQGADSFIVYRLGDDAYMGRFRIVGGATDGTSHTDGIELVLGNMGDEFPGGLFVAQDDDNRPQPQNFKFVAWGDVLKALHLMPDPVVANDRH
jgi:3-phytase